ncbi:MAG: 50S ribosomal protein L13 [Planctomycetes bacterium]|nr:50S ribosomal protein L13 [Planctomycetota bacterium]
MATFMAKKGAVEQKWYVVDADGKVLGRLAARVATVLQGKHKPIYTPHVDTGDFVVVVNADKVKVTGKKLAQRKYYRYSNYPGGLKTFVMGDLQKKHPDRIVRLAVRRMLPQTGLGKRMYEKLKVYAGPDHPHKAQQPAALAV